MLLGEKNLTILTGKVWKSIVSITGAIKNIKSSFVIFPNSARLLSDVKWYFVLSQLKNKPFTSATR